MALSISFPYPPMEAQPVRALPPEGLWQYEPKWDGFRAILFKDGAKVELQSKAQKSLSRYFPEIINAAENGPERFVLDGELVILRGAALSFDDLLQRIHPAESRIRLLAANSPAIFIAFDLLLDEKGKKIAGLPLAERRSALERFAKLYFPKLERFRLSPVSLKEKDTKDWIKRSGASLDGIIAKQRDLPYQSGLREGMVKLKFMHSADCVVGGIRERSGSISVLLLGLYDVQGDLQYVGHTSPPRGVTRREFKKLPLSKNPFGERSPGGVSRWSKDGEAKEWTPVEPTRVIEVQYDHFTGGRFRHGTKFLRWRPDKDPVQCTLKQTVLEAKSGLLLDSGEVLEAGKTKKKTGAKPKKAKPNPAESRTGGRVKKLAARG